MPSSDIISIREPSRIVTRLRSAERVHVHIPFFFLIQ